MNIDLNCDLGEGAAHDAELMPLITSANIACGFHAGGPATAWATLRDAFNHGVRAGAHPSFPDRADFGRREMARTEQQIFEDCTYQVGALDALARAAGGALGHLKAHGALYNMACRSDEVARPLIEVARFFRLPLFGLPGSRLGALASGRVEFIAEGFADRRYLPDGTLVPRVRPDAMLDDPGLAAEQAQWLIRTKGVRTLCVHGDNPRALEFVRGLRESLTRLGHHLRPYGGPETP